MGGQVEASVPLNDGGSVGGWKIPAMTKCETTKAEGFFRRWEMGDGRLGISHLPSAICDFRKGGQRSKKWGVRGRRHVKMKMKMEVKVKAKQGE